MNQNEKLRLIDVANLQPKRENLKSFGILGLNDILGSVYILTPKDRIENIQNEILEILSRTRCLDGGCTKLPDENGLLIRLLGSFVSDVRKMIYSIVEIVRHYVLNISFSVMRKA